MRLLFLSFVLGSTLHLNFAHSKVKEGQKMPSFALEYVTKKGQLKSSVLKGKVVLLDFWASWCGPCKKSFPFYKELYKKYAKKKGKLQFVIVGVNVDESKKEARVFLKSTPVKFPIVFDKEKKLVEKVGVTTMPTALIVDKKGKIHEIHKGFREGDEANIEKLVTKLLGK